MLPASGDGRRPTCFGSRPFPRVTHPSSGNVPAALRPTNGSAPPFREREAQMEFFDTIRQRHSVRTFLREPIPPESLQRILEAANLAPSAGDLQAYEIYQVQDRGTQEALAVAAYDQAFIEEAPLALIFVASPFRARRYGERGHLSTPSRTRRSPQPTFNWRRCRSGWPRAGSGRSTKRRSRRSCTFRRARSRSRSCRSGSRASRRLRRRAAN